MISNIILTEEPPERRQRKIRWIWERSRSRDSSLLCSPLLAHIIMSQVTVSCAGAHSQEGQRHPSSPPAGTREGIRVSLGKLVSFEG